MSRTSTPATSSRSTTRSWTSSVAYMTEAGYWTITDEEAAAFRVLPQGRLRHLRRLPRRLRQRRLDELRRPDAARAARRALLDLSPTHPIFHAFYDIDSLDIVPQYYDRGTPVFRAVYEDNDPSKRMMAVVDFNTDISNFWEFSPWATARSRSRTRRTSSA